MRQKRLKMKVGTSLVIQQRRPQAPNARGPGSIPGQRTRSHMLKLRVPTCHSKDRGSCVLRLSPGAAKQSYYKKIHHPSSQSIIKYSDMCFIVLYVCIYTGMYITM